MQEDLVNQLQSNKLHKQVGPYIGTQKKWGAGKQHSA